MRPRLRYWVRVYIYGEGRTLWLTRRRTWETTRRELRRLGARYYAGEGGRKSP